MPPKISAGQCGTTTIGLNHSTRKNLKNFSDAEGVGTQKSILSGVKVISHFPQTTVSYFDSISFSSSLQNDAEIIVPQDGATARVEIISVESNGKKIDKADYENYFSISEEETSVAHTTPSFLFTSHDKPVSVTAKIVYKIPLLDGSIQEKFSENFVLTVNSAFLSATLAKKSGEPLTKISLTDSDEVILKVLKKENISDDGKISENFSADIFDDISGEVVVKNISGRNGILTLPASVIKNTSSYRAILHDEKGITGIITFSVVP